MLLLKDNQHLQGSTKFLLGKRTIRRGTTLTALLIAVSMPRALGGKAAPTICGTFSPTALVIQQCQLSVLGHLLGEILVTAKIIEVRACKKGLVLPQWESPALPNDSKQRDIYYE